MRFVLLIVINTSWLTILGQPQFRINNSSPKYIKETSYAQKSDTVFIYYNFIQSEKFKKYKVSVSLSYDDGWSYEVPVIPFFGDIGDTEIGQPKTIKWNITKSESAKSNLVIVDIRAKPRKS